MADVKLTSLENLRAVDNEDGSFTLRVAGATGGGGGGGSSDTTEETQLLVLGELQSIDAKTPALAGSRMPVYAANVTTKFREAFEAFTPGTRWTQQLASGDIIQIDGNAAAASYLSISKDPLSAGTVSTIETVETFGMPFDTALGLHMSQRTLGQEFSVEFVSTDTPLPAPADLAIASITQATTTLTVNTTLPHGLRPGMRIGIRDCVDSRFNYPALVVATTPSTTQFTVTAGPAGALPAVTAGPFTSGFVFFRSALGFAPNGTSMIFENATATNASFYVRSESGDVLPSGTIAGNHAVTILSTASVQAINAALTYAFQPTNEFRLSQFINGVQWSDAPIDSLAAATNRYKRTQVVPDISHDYRLRIRATNNASLTRPIAQIVSATKTGTTTATVVTDVPHGLTTGDQINAYTRDTVNYPALVAATAVASVVNATTFTVVWGGAVTATSFGGLVARVNGGQNLQGTLGNALVQSVVRTANILTVTGSGAISGALIGDYINLVGCRNAVDGATLGIDGAYRVRNIVASTIELEPIGSTPTGADILSTNCGGLLIRRTCLRISFVRVLDFERHRVEILPRPQGDISEAVSVNVQNIPAVTVSSGTVTTVSTVSALTGGGVAEDAAAGANPVVVGGVVRTARAPVTLIAGDAARTTMTTEGSMTVQPGPVVPLIEVASAARTTTGNSGLISVAAGGGLSGLIAVTAASGTTPTLDITLEESFDNGTTWTQVWAAPRLTGISTAVIPPMLTSGLRRWVWTLAGTTPSFTFAITANAVPSPCPIIRQIFDRTAGLLTGTLNATSASVPIAGCKALSAKVSLAAAGTPGTYQIQISDDNAAWSNVGTATIAIANSVLTLVMPAGVTANFARVICTVAGATQTGNYVAINAVS